MKITVAILVTRAQKTAVENACNAATPGYNLEFLRPVAPIATASNPATPPSHWYVNNEYTSEELLATWQAILPTLEGVVFWIAYDSTNSLEWAYSNLASEGLAFLSDGL